MSLSIEGSGRWVLLRCGDCGRAVNVTLLGGHSRLGLALPESRRVIDVPSLCAGPAAAGGFSRLSGGGDPVGGGGECAVDPVGGDGLPDHARSIDAGVAGAAARYYLCVLCLPMQIHILERR